MTAFTLAGAGGFLGHPRGLVICFFTEMWERFSYYGMRALLIFYLTRHFLFSDGEAAGIYAAYISLVYLAPVLGGVVADRWLGTGRAVMLGGILLLLGHLGMALEGAPARLIDGARVQNGFQLQVFYLSLALIIAGVGFLKANISTLVGALYERRDPRRDAGFTLFYMGINLGAFFGALVCGLLLEYGGFSWGFGAAAVGMLAGLVTFMRGRAWFAGADAPPFPERLARRVLPGLRLEHLVYFGALASVLVFWLLLQHRALIGGLLAGTLLLMAGVIIGYALLRCAREDRDRLLVCLFLMSYQVVFWSLFEQAGSSLNLMTDRHVDRVLFGMEVPAAVFQSVNAFFIMLLAPLFSLLWVTLARRGLEPSTPVKFALALIQLGLGFICLVYGAGLAASPTQVALLWLLLLYLLHTTGELCLSPVGLSMTTRLSVPGMVGMMMGCWFLALAAGNYVSGWFAAMTGATTPGGEVLDAGAALEGYLRVYAMYVFYSIALGVVALLLAPFLRRHMHGIR